MTAHADRPLTVCPECDAPEGVPCPPTCPSWWRGDYPIPHQLVAS